MSNGLHRLMLLVGELRGELKHHIANSERALDQRDADREESAEYRKEVRRSLRNLSMQVSAIGPLSKRLDAIEPHVEDYKTVKIKLGVAVVMATGAWSIIVGGLAYFGTEIKELIFRLFRM